VTAVWAIEWRLALNDGRRFLLSALVPLAIAAAVATGVAAPRPAAAVHLVVFLAFSVLGAALPLRWDGERGIVRRVVRGGVPAGRYLILRAGAGATIDLVQLTPALLVVALAGSASPLAVLVAFAALAFSVWIAALTGVLAAALSRSLAESALVAGLAVLLLAHSAGAFETAEPSSLLAAIEAVAPVRVLHEALLDLTVGGTPNGFLVALAWGLLLPGLVWLLGDRIAASLGSVGPGGLEGL
jgi:hypothetical protein